MSETRPHTNIGLQSCPSQETADTPCALLTATACSWQSAVISPLVTFIAQQTQAFRDMFYVLTLPSCVQPQPTHALASCIMLSPLLSRNPGPKHRLSHPMLICVTEVTQQELLTDCWGSPQLLYGICASGLPFPRKTGLDKEALRGQAGESTLTGRPWALRVPTHGSMLILVSSFTTQMPKELSTWSRKHGGKGLNETDLMTLCASHCLVDMVKTNCKAQREGQTSSVLKKAEEETK